MLQIKDKPWGFEDIIYQKDNVQFKLLNIKKDEMLSFQFHKEKLEVILAMDDNCKVIYDGNEIHLKRGEFLFIENTKYHRFIGQYGDTVLAELSFGDDSDIVRIADKYERP